MIEKILVNPVSTYEHRQVRSIRLTDTIWIKLGSAADKRRITRADLVEQLAEEGFFDGEINAGDHQMLSKVEAAIRLILNDSAVTRNGKDKGAVKRGLEALLKHLESV